MIVFTNHIQYDLHILNIFGGNNFSKYYNISIGGGEGEVNIEIKIIFHFIHMLKLPLYKKICMKNFIFNSTATILKN